MVAIDAGGNPVNTCSLAPASTSWACSSDRALKENFTTVDGQEVLRRLSTMPIMKWNVRGADPTIQHVGPTAQDFYAAFQLGDSDKHISTTDLDGMALLAIQALYQRALQKDREIRQLTEAVQDLRAANETLRTQMTSLLERMAQVSPPRPR